MIVIASSYCPSVSFASLERFSKSIFETKIYSTNNIKFKISNEKIKELLEGKALLKLDNDFFAEITVRRDPSEEFFENVLTIKINGLNPKHEKLTKKIKSIFMNKSKIVVGHNIQNWLKNYALVKKHKDFDIYKDQTGLLEVAEIRVKYEKEMLLIIEKKPVGTLRTTYKYEVYPWSGKKLVLIKVTREKFEGNQSIIVTNTIQYSRFKIGLWLPSSMISDVAQRVNSNSDHPVKRKVVEKYLFYDYDIN